MKNEFMRIFTENVKRDGADKLLAYLETTDFFTAPASTKYHLACDSGLVQHSINVYNRFNCDDAESRAICALLHDVCKANYYTVSTRNVKNEQTGQWEKVPFYSVDDQLPYGHGEKSVYIIGGFMKLTRDEAMAIRWHMGAYEGEKAWNNVSAAFEKYPIAFHLHMADMQATYLDEVRV